jgi:hypothetical protein
MANIERIPPILPQAPARREHTGEEREELAGENQREKRRRGLDEVPAEKPRSKKP